MGAMQATAAPVVLSLIATLLSGCWHDQLRGGQDDPIAVLPAEVVDCPAGYRLQTGSIADVSRVIHSNNGSSAADKCGRDCDLLEGCRGFRFTPLGEDCVPLFRNSSQGDDMEMALQWPGSQVCSKAALRSFSKTEAPLLGATEIVEQEDGDLKIGDTLWLYAIGSSSLVWMTWVDQLHLALRRLGYKLPAVPANRTPEVHPRVVPICDDTKYFQHLKTSRFGRIGWSSWDFALEGWEGCGADGFRHIRDLRVKCQHGAGCVFSKNPLFVSDIAQDASRSNITLVATWFNDDQHWSTHYKCFAGVKKDTEQIAPITVHCLLKTVRAIRERNPRTWIVVMGKYPQTYKHKNYAFVSNYNTKVREAVEKEPKTLFVEYYIPSDAHGEFYQPPSHGGHPNCRGSKIMSYAVLEKLYKEKVLSRGLLLDPLVADNLLKGSQPGECSKLSIAACHTSALCWIDPQVGKCVKYSPGHF
mmetsp:Transcript_17180/g.40339  ORF Transcript_17180/g.40339 Transcript_17180/m.40339 type:complete len:472 (+) Transcript_17180:35-1450(+)